MLLAVGLKLSAQTPARGEAVAHASFAIAPSQASSNAPPRFTWSPPQGFLFVEGNCGSDDQTLGWMAPIAPKVPKDAKLIMFTNGESWMTRFEEACKHFITRWTALKGREVVVVPGDYGRLKDDPILVRVPKSTPFAAGTFEEAIYLQGYAGGYMDQQNLRQSTEAPVTGARGQGWCAGWAAASLNGGR
jgi:hypothetical protein